MKMRKLLTVCAAICLFIFFGGLAQAGVTAVSFPEDVEARGQIRTRLERAYQRLCSPPLDDPEFVLADLHFRLTRFGTNWSGDLSGRMLGALNAAGPLIGRSTPMLDTLIAALPYYQHSDGHFGVEQNLAKSIDQDKDMALLWGNGRLLLAMVQRYQQNPDPRLLTVAKRLGEYILSTRPYYGREENFTRVGGVFASGFTTVYPGLINGLVALGEVTGEKRFYEEARFIAKLSLLNRKFEKHHSHGRLTTFCGMLDLDRLTGSRQFIDAVSTDCKRITEGFLLPTGGVTETFDLTHPRGEACAEADWIRVNFLLWRATGDTSYLDAAERVLQNHLLATQVSNGGFGCYTFDVLRDGDSSYLGGGIGNVGLEAYWCCSMSGTQILADVARWGTLVSDKAILITWLSEGRSRLTIGGQNVTVTTEKAAPSLWKIWLYSHEQTATTLRLRVPGLAKAITVNGETYSSESGWVEIPCEWSGTLSLEVRLPDRIRLAGAYKTEPKENMPVRIFAGADLFGLPEAYIGKGLLADDAIPTVILAADRPSNKGRIPVVIQGLKSRTQQAELVPLSQRPPGGCRILFKVRRVNAKKFKEFVAAAAPAPEPGIPIELMFACDGEYELYLNGEKVFHDKKWQESPRVVVYTDRTSNVLAVKARSEAAQPGYVYVDSSRSEATQPGLIGLAQVGTRVYGTHPDDWSVVPCPNEPSGEWLTDLTKGAGQAEKLADLGGFGVPPWKHIPAQFAGTSARWIWPEVDNPRRDRRWWLFRYSFEIDNDLPF